MKRDEVNLIPVQNSARHLVCNIAAIACFLTHVVPEDNQRLCWFIINALGIFRLYML